jgi:AcrR family transcriptional regulator
MGKAEETKARVERAALTLFVARGVAETTTREIAMAASIAEGTIYRYFPSKEQLALDIFLGHHRALAEALAEAHRPATGLRDKIQAIVRCYCEWADRDWSLFAYHLLTQHLFLALVPDGTPNPVDVVREVIVSAMSAGRDTDAGPRPRGRLRHRHRHAARDLQGLRPLRRSALRSRGLLRRRSVGGARRPGPLGRQDHAPT